MPPADLSRWDTVPPCCLIAIGSKQWSEVDAAHGQPSAKLKACTLIPTSTPYWPAAPLLA
jgi:hypothetical protein